MKTNLKKSGQKILRKFSRASIKAGEEGKEHLKKNFFERFSHVANIKLLVLEWGLLVFALIMLSIAQAIWFVDSYAENTYTGGGTYTEATLGDVNSMNPLFATTSSEKVLSRLMFATIATIDYSGHPGIGLAKSIRSSENGKIWTIKLRDNLKWSDGEAITNEDVLFTADLIKNPAVNTIYDSNLSNVSVTENEAGEIVFNLPAPYADFVSALNIPVLPKHVLEKADPKTLIENNFSVNPITSGAFSFNALQSTSDGNEKTVYLSSNEKYYKGEPLLTNFAVHTFSDKKGVIDAVNAGSVTATAELSGAEADGINSGHFYKRNSSLNSGVFMFLNVLSSKLKNNDIRTAIRQGLDMAAIREKAPETTKLDYPLIPSQIKLTNYPKIPEMNKEAARNKISECSGENKIHLEIATVNSGYLPNVAEEIKNQLEELGFEVNVSIHEENREFISNIISERNYDILLYEIELGADPDLLPYYHSSQISSAGLNLSNYKNLLVDDLLLSARGTLDENLRVKKYENFLEYWVANVPAIGLYQPNLTYIYNKNARTFSDDIKLVTALDRFTDVTDWAVNKTTKNKTP